MEQSDVVLDSLDGPVKIVHHFVDSRHHDNFGRPEGQGRHAVSEGIDVDQLAVSGDGVGAAQEHIGEKGLPPQLERFLRR